MHSAVHTKGMNAIELSLANGGWMATYIGPHAETMFALFGTITLPTAFSSDFSADEVLSQIQACNPSVQVYLEPCICGAPAPCSCLDEASE